MNEERIKEILAKIKNTVGENNYKLALAITGHRPGKIRDVLMSSKDGELLLDYITNLQQELTKYKERNEKLKDKIQKVIEKLDDLENNYGCGENEFVFAKDEVLKILEDKENK